jgi:putative membrane protein
MLTSKTILFLAIAGASNAAVAAQNDSPSPKTFVEKAAQDGMTEVELGKVALEKSRNPEVRNFALRMVEDHGKANRELAALAKQKGIDAPKELDAEHQPMVKNLEAKDGASFDSEYSHHMNMDHSKAISLFEAASNSPDKEFASFAKKTLPTLKEHKEMASKLPGQ